MIDTRYDLTDYLKRRLEKEDFTFKEVNVEDSTLFWLSEKENIFSNDSRVMFPLLSHA